MAEYRAIAHPSLAPHLVELSPPLPPINYLPPPPPQEGGPRYALNQRGRGFSSRIISCCSPNPISSTQISAMPSCLCSLPSTPPPRSPSMTDLDQGAALDDPKTPASRTRSLSQNKLSRGQERGLPDERSQTSLPQQAAAGGRRAPQV